MNGSSRTFFAALASLLRLFAWPPFGLATAINAAANWCDERAGVTAAGGEG